MESAGVAFGIMGFIFAIVAMNKGEEAGKKLKKLEKILKDKGVLDEEL